MLHTTADLIAAVESFVASRAGNKQNSHRLLCQTHFFFQHQVAWVVFMSSFLRLTHTREDEKVLRISKATLVPGARSEARE